LLFLEFWVCAARDPEIRARLHDALARVRGSIAEQLVAWFEEMGTDAPEPVEELAAAILVVGSGFLFAKLADPDGVPDGVLTHVMTNVWRGVLGPEKSVDLQVSNKSGVRPSNQRASRKPGGRD